VLIGVNSLPSKFNFVKSLPPKTEAIEGEKLFELPAFDADASDYPELLAIALRAWEHARSVSTGTPKQRIMAFLDSNYPHLAKGTKEIIAQVANWNRTGGRPSGD
jgi:hypothetical protein